MNEMSSHESYSEFDVAIIGLSGRFPGAKNVNEFWQNIKNVGKGLINISRRPS